MAPPALPSSEAHRHLADLCDFDDKVRLLHVESWPKLQKNFIHKLNGTLDFSRRFPISFMASALRVILNFYEN